jgi:ABC-type phosphate transport system substrate-binding protein
MALKSARRLATACAVSAAAVAALAAPGVASATTSLQCTGENITAAGSTLQELAQKDVWNPDFNTSTNKLACSGSQGSKAKPTVSYDSIGSGPGLEKWGYNGHAFEAGSFAIAATDEPVNAAQKEEIEKNETTSTPETVQSIPVLQGAVAIIIDLPANCTATSTAAPGRLVLNNSTLAKIWTDEVTKWSQITEDGDSVTGTGCDAETPITHVVREEGSGTTHIFKKYLQLSDATPFETEKGASKDWNELSEGPENTTWPKADAVVRAPGSGKEAAKVAEIASSIGYVNLANARANGKFTPGVGDGGAGTQRFWAEIQNSGTSKKPTYSDPATNGDAEATANSNCAKEKYTNGTDTKFPPASTADVWNEVTTSTKEVNYPLCGLTYDTVLSDYGAYPGTTTGEAITASNYLLWVLEDKAGGGSELILNHDYEPIPKALVKEAETGVKRVEL